MSTDKYPSIFSRQMKAIVYLFAKGEVNIGEYLPRRSRVKCSPIFTEPEANNCFSVIFRGEYQESAKQNAKTR